MQRMWTAKLQTVMNAGTLWPADPDERRTRATHSLVEDAAMRLLELNGHRPRRSQPLLINAGFHTVEVALSGSSVFRSRRQSKRLASVQHSPAHACVFGRDGHHRPPVASALGQGVGPSAHRVCFVLGQLQHRSGSQYQQRPQIRVTPCRSSWVISRPSGTRCE